MARWWRAGRNRWKPWPARSGPITGLRATARTTAWRRPISSAPTLCKPGGPRSGGPATAAHGPCPTCWSGARDRSARERYGGRYLHEFAAAERPVFLGALPGEDDLARLAPGAV